MPVMFRFSGNRPGRTPRRRTSKAFPKRLNFLRSSLLFSSVLDLYSTTKLQPPTRCYSKLKSQPERPIFGSGTLHLRRSGLYCPQRFESCRPRVSHLLRLIRGSGREALEGFCRFPTQVEPTSSRIPGFLIAATIG